MNRPATGWNSEWDSEGEGSTGAAAHGGSSSPPGSESSERVCAASPGVRGRWLCSRAPVRADSIPLGSGSYP
jgi:hypothetical protein